MQSGTVNSPYIGLEGIYIYYFEHYRGRTNLEEKLNKHNVPKYFL